MTLDAQMPQSPTVAERLRSIRALRNLAKSTVAERVPIQVRTLTNWENGSTEPAASHLAALARIYKVSTDWLVGRTESMSGIDPGMWMIDEDRLRQTLDGQNTERLEFAWRVPVRHRFVSEDESDEINEAVETAIGGRKR